MATLLVARKQATSKGFRRHGEVLMRSAKPAAAKLTAMRLAHSASHSWQPFRLNADGLPDLGHRSNIDPAFRQALSPPSNLPASQIFRGKSGPRVAGGALRTRASRR